MLEIYDVSDFELKMLQPVSYWGKNLDTRQIFTIEFHTVSDFAENFAKNSRHVFFYFVERTEFGVLCFKKAWFWIRIDSCVRYWF